MDEGLRLRFDSLSDYDACVCRGLEEHAKEWPGCLTSYYSAGNVVTAGEAPPRSEN